MKTNNKTTKTVSLFKYVQNISLAAGLFSLIPIEEIYLKTFIPLSTLLIIMGVSSFLGSIVYLLFNAKKYSFIKGIFVFNFLGIGSLCCLCFLWINYQYTDNVKRGRQFEIVKVLSVPGKRIKGKKHFTVYYKTGADSTKKIYFSGKYSEKMKTAKNVSLALEKGYFGYDVIKRQSPI